MIRNGSQLPRGPPFDLDGVDFGFVSVGVNAIASNDHKLVELVQRIFKPVSETVFPAPENTSLSPTTARTGGSAPVLARHRSTAVLGLVNGELDVSAKRGTSSFEVRELIQQLGSASCLPMVLDDDVNLRVVSTDRE